MERNKINPNVWEMLKDDEKTALSLSLGYGKSSWEVGEIMDKAHFKYLEIQKRGQKFLEIFTNHFEKYGALFPNDIEISFSFKEYLHLTIIERKNISTAINDMDSSKYIISSLRNKLIIAEIEKLKNSPKESAKDLYNLIMDFDRWNNFRILPIEIQEPSAFKRRNKTRNIKHLRNITSLPKFSVLKLIDRYSYSGKYNKLYLPVISGYLGDGYRVITIKDKDTILNEVTNIGLFVFTTRAKAEEFAVLVYEYFLNTKKDCKTGQKFWPKFRALMAEAKNHKSLENIHRSRTYLDKAIFTE